MEAAQAAVVAVDVALAIPVVASLTLLLLHHLRPPPSPPLSLQPRPLPLLLSYHLLLFAQWLPTLLSCLLPLPCSAVLVPLFASTHLLLFLCTASAVALALQTQINRHILASLPPTPVPSPSTSSSEQGRWVQAATLPYQDGGQGFAITLQPIGPAPPTTPPNDNVPGHHFQSPLRWLPPLLGALLLLTLVCLVVSLLNGAASTAPCGQQTTLLLVLLASLAPYPAVWAVVAWHLRGQGDLYHRRREAALLAGCAFPLHAAALVWLQVDWSTYAVLLLHLSQAVVALITTGLPLTAAYREGGKAKSEEERERVVKGEGDALSDAAVEELLTAPPPALLAHLQSALQLPSLALLLALHSYHRLFLPSASFHLPLRNLHLERVRQKRRRRSSGTGQTAGQTTPPSPSSPSSTAHLRRVLTHAWAIYRQYLHPDSYRCVRVPAAVRARVREGLHRLHGEAAAAGEEAQVAVAVEEGGEAGKAGGSRLRVGGGRGRMRCNCCWSWVSCTARWSATAETTSHRRSDVGGDRRRGGGGRGGGRDGGADAFAVTE